ncbi:MAG: glycosyltransferase family 2 protein [Rhodothermales bacterium]|nr:glycosyltransferase family 2 protein [Rhodothermales bacterium]
MATVIVPAHNESAVISDCLESIVDQEGVDDVIVACNGCSDDTADIVRLRFPGVHCLDIAEASKTNALNVAEEKAKELGMVFPLFYIDADTRLGPNAVKIIDEALASSPILLAAPTPVIDTSQSSWLVKQYYKTWLDLPYVKQGVIATCSYILTARGRERFDEFPEVVSDDGYVRGHFRASEISNIAPAEIYIRAPRDVVSLIKIKTRARLGNKQLLATGQWQVREHRSYGRILIKRLFSRSVVSTLVYISVTLIMRTRANWQFRRISQYQWEKDLSSR